MKPEDVEEDQAGSFHGRGELGQGHEVCHLAEMVHNVEDGCVAVRRGRPVAKSKEMCDQG